MPYRRKHQAGAANSLATSEQTVKTACPELPDTHPALRAQLCFAFYTAAHRLTRAYRPLLEPLGLTYLQYFVMLVLWESAPSSVGELGDALFLDSGTLTPLLKRLERAELVIRRRDPQDERRVLISLTDKGHALEPEAGGISSEIRCQLDMDPVEIEDMRMQVMKLVARLDKAKNKTDT